MAVSHTEISNILAAIETGKIPTEQMALATVVEVEGSSYRRVGARMLIQQNGNWIGAISGGCLEGNALRLARQTILDRTPQLVTYDTRTDESARAIGASLGCNGIIRVWIEPLSGPGALAHLQALKAAFSGSAPSWLARRVEGPAGTIGDTFSLSAPEKAWPAAELRREPGLQTVFQAGEPHCFAIEEIRPAIRLLIFGAGSDALPLTHLARQLGWRTTVTDDCAAKALPIRFPEADQVVRLDREVAAAQLHPDAFSAAVLVSHNYAYDKAVLTGLLPFALPYIGMLGPKKRFLRMDQELGGRLQALPNLHAPIGLDIGAEAPFEIALAIVAEIQAVFAQRAGGLLRDRPGFIHARRALAQ